MNDHHRSQVDKGAHTSMASGSKTIEKRVNLATKEWQPKPVWPLELR